MRALFLIAVLSGCIERTPFSCSTNVQCISPDGTSGLCQPSGYCSFPDSACGQRYGAAAPAALAKKCVSEISDGGLVGDGPHNFMFVTSQSYPVSISVADADQACQQLADGSTVPGLMGKTYRAWLSDPSASALSRMVTPDQKPVGGWLRPDGLPFAVSRDALVAGDILYPPRINEANRDVDTTVEVIVNTRTNEEGGYLAAGNGSAVGTSGLWTHRGADNASGDMRRLYCMGIDFSTTLELHPQAGRLAFLTHAPFDPSSGIGAADQLCTDAAVQVGRSGTFRALLSTTSETAAHRFTAGAQWVRIDGLPWVVGLDELRQGKVLTALSLDETGKFSTEKVWTGGGEAGTPNSGISEGRYSCNDWSSAGAAVQATVGQANMSDLHFFAWSVHEWACDDPGLGIYCLQND